MSRMQREKGKAGEREVAKILKDRGYDARRGQQYCGAAGDADVIGLPKIHLEVKRTETCRLYDYYEQAEYDAKKGEIPVVVHRQSRKNWLAIMDFEDFLDLYKKAYPQYSDSELIG